MLMTGIRGVTKRGRRFRSVWFLLLLLLFVAGCGRGCTSRRPPIHIIPDMDQQPKYRAQAESNFFYDGGTMRVPVEGTVARGQLEEDRFFYTGKGPDGSYVNNPLPATSELLARGHERYEIYCTPCHGDRGDGQGMLFLRSGIRSTDLHEERMRDIPDGQIFEVISDGLGMMPGYRYPIPAHDRWAIIAFVRRLQEEER